MSDILVTSPFQPFTLPSQFKAVFNGYIYCGTVDAVDPSVSQVQIYLVNESGAKIPVAQPLRTNAGGFLVYNGQPAKFVTDSNHSLLVQDSLHAQVWYAPDIALADPETAMAILGAQTREALRRSYAEAGYTLVAGSFEAGGTLTSASDVLLHEASGKAFSGPAGVVAAGTDPASGGFIDKSGELLRAQLADVNSEVLVGGVEAKTLQTPYVITGRANIRNPVWGAPIANAADPGAATANRTAINAMLASGNRICELDDNGRYIDGTLVVGNSTQTLRGCSKDTLSLIYNGPDAPVVGRVGYDSASPNGMYGLRVEDMRINDLCASRVNHYSIDLSDAHSSGIERVHLQGVDGTNLSDKYGVLLGRRGTPGSSVVFVCHIRFSRLEKAKALINTTDSYVESNELWGNSRDFSLVLQGGGQIVTDNQIVPGATAGIRIPGTTTINKIVDNYFDGSYPTIFTGDGIYADTLNNSIVSDNVFWHLNGQGVRISSATADRVTNNVFEDCNLADLAGFYADVNIGAMMGCTIDNTHNVGIGNPKTGTARVNKPYPLLLTLSNAAVAGSISSIKENVIKPSAVTPSLIGNTLTSAEFADEGGRILNRSSVPNASVGPFGAIVNVGGVAYIRAGGGWHAI